MKLFSLSVNTRLATRGKKARGRAGRLDCEFQNSKRKETKRDMRQVNGPWGRKGSVFSTQESPRGTQVSTLRGARRPEKVSCREMGKTATEKEREGMGGERRWGGGLAGGGGEEDRGKEEEGSVGEKGERTGHREQTSRRRGRREQ